MKKSILISFAAVSVLFLTGCGNASSSKEENHEGHDHAMHEVGKGQTEPLTAEGIQINNDGLNAVYQAYVQLNQALVDSDVAAAKVAANMLELGAKELKGGSALAGNAAIIAEANTIKEGRAAFSELSNVMIALVKESKLKSGKLYIAYCPMALNDEGGYWLSNENAIKNPYFGESMMTCGEIKGTI